MGHLLESRAIKIPAQRLFQQVCDLANSSDWSRQISQSTTISGDGGVGTRARLHMYDGTEMVQEVTTLEPNRRLVGSEMHELPFPVAAMSAQWSVTEVAPGECEVTIDADYKLRGGLFGSALDALMVRRMFRRAHLNMLEDLDYHLSTGRVVGKEGAAAAGPALAAVQP